MRYEELWSDAQFGEFLRNVHKEDVMLDLEASMTSEERRIMRHLRQVSIEKQATPWVTYPGENAVIPTEQREEP